MNNGLHFPGRNQELEVPQSILCLDPSSPKWDIVFVAFDLEFKKRPNRNNPTYLPNGIREIGVSMLDTRGLSSSNLTSRLTTRHIVVGGINLVRKLARSVHFGTSEQIGGNTEEAVNEAVLELLHIPDDMSNFTKKKYRDIVLVGHGINSDLGALKKRGMEIEKVATIVARFDTSRIVQSVLGTGSNLRALLVTLGCPSANVHLAGNDANYALRAMLVLVYYGSRPSVTSADAIKTLLYLKALGLEPLGDTASRNKIVQASIDALCLPKPGEDGLFNALEMGMSIFDEV